MKILLTGATGFIGSHIYKGLHKKHSILKTSHTDLYFSDTLKNHVKGNDYIIHTATWGNIYTHDKDDKTYSANIGVTQGIIEEAIRQNTGILYFSTSSVNLPVQTMYSTCKRCCEMLIETQCNKHKIPYIIIRPYTVIGAGEQQEHLIPTLIRSARTGDVMDFAPNPSHDYVDVKDVVSAIDHILDNKEKFERSTVDIGSGVSHTNEDIRRIVASLMGKEPKVEVKDAIRPYDTSKWKANITPLYWTGWEPKISLVNTIQKMIDYGY